MSRALGSSLQAVAVMRRIQADFKRSDAVHHDFFLGSRLMGTSATGAMISASGLAQICDDLEQHSHYAGESRWMTLLECLASWPAFIAGICRFPSSKSLRSRSNMNKAVT